MGMESEVTNIWNEKEELEGAWTNIFFKKKHTKILHLENFKNEMHLYKKKMNRK